MTIGDYCSLLVAVNTCLLIYCSCLFGDCLCAENEIEQINYAAISTGIALFFCFEVLILVFLVESRRYVRVWICYRLILECYRQKTTPEMSHCRHWQTTFIRIRDYISIDNSKCLYRPSGYWSKLFFSCFQFLSLISFVYLVLFLFNIYFMLQEEKIIKRDDK